MSTGFSSTATDQATRRGPYVGIRIEPAMRQVIHRFRRDLPITDNTALHQTHKQAIFHQIYEK
jgi:hypothetical protein